MRLGASERAQAAGESAHRRRHTISEVAAKAVIGDEHAFAEFVGTLPSGVAALVRRSDALVRAVDHDATQVLWTHQRTVGYGIGPKKLSEHYCYLDVYHEHLNLGFNHGVALADPSRLLAGTGARFRHRRIGRLTDLDDPALRDLIAAAVEERRQACA